MSGDFSKDKNAIRFAVIYCSFAIPIGIVLLIFAVCGKIKYPDRLAFCIITVVLIFVTSFFEMYFLLYNRNAYFNIYENTIEFKTGLSDPKIISIDEIENVICDGHDLLIFCNNRIYKIKRINNAFTLSKEIKIRKAAVDGDSDIVLVGSTRTPMQRKANIKYNFYHIPTVQIPDNIEVKYIAIYESNISKNGGVRWYGRVKASEIRKRKDIPYPISQNNPEESYYYFKIEKWIKREPKIDYLAESIYEARFSTKFLLDKSKNTYELLLLNTVSEFHLIRELEEMATQNELKDYHDIIDDIEIDVISNIIKLKKEDKELRFPISEIKCRPTVIFNQILEFIRVK